MSGRRPKYIIYSLRCHCLNDDVPIYTQIRGIIGEKLKINCRPNALLTQIYRLRKYRKKAMPKIFTFRN